MISECWFSDAQWKKIPSGAMATTITPSVRAHATWAAKGRLNIGVRETHTSFCQFVDVRRVEMWVAITT